MEIDISSMLADAGNTAILALLLYRVLWGIERLAGRVIDILEEAIKRMPAEAKSPD